MKQHNNTQYIHDDNAYDIIGDIHGCFEELVILLNKLNYTIQDTTIIPSQGRKLLFVGDYGDRGNHTPDVFRLVMNAIGDGHAYGVMGNHDYKLMKVLQGRNMSIAPGLQKTLDQLADEPEILAQDIRRFIEDLPTHIILDQGKLVIAHAGILEADIGKQSGRVRAFNLYGDTTGERDEHGYPIRRDWAQDYTGDAVIVYGHTPRANTIWVNNTMNIDTGCVFGGKLTALRYPEREVVSVDALALYAESKRILS